MEFKKYKLKDVVDVLNKTINPQKNKSIDFSLYSLPAFDNNKTPEACKGEQINSNKFIIDREAILFNKLNIRFKRIWNLNSINDNSICSTEFIPLVANQKIILKDYLYYLLISDEFNNGLIESSTGTSNSHQRINKEILLEKNVYLPSIKNQKRISSILEKLDKKIELNNQVNDNLYEIGKSYYKYFFKQYKHTNKFIETELGRIPMNYEVKSLFEVTKNNREKVKEDTEYKVLSAVKTGNLQLSEEYFNKSVPSTELNRYIIVKKDDFAYNPARINIGSIGRNEYDFKTCVSPVYVSFSIDNKYKYFWDFYFKDIAFKKEVNTRASGSVRQSLKYEDLGLIKLVYPNKDTINKFNYLYNKIDMNIKQREKENKILKQLRDTLLPKLMNGEIDLENIEI